jgi:hypothetical protein
VCSSDLSASTPAIELDPVDGVVFTAASFDAAAITSGVIDNNRLPPIPDNAFNASTTITATNASWPVPALGSPIVKVTVIGGGGGGGAATLGVGGTGGTSSFVVTGKTISSIGGLGGRGTANTGSTDARVGFTSGNGGGAGVRADLDQSGTNGHGGVVTVGYADLTGISTANVTIGGGGAGGSGNGTAGKAGGRGEVIVEYKAG